MHRTPRQTPPHLAWALPLGVLFFACGILLGRSLPVVWPALVILGLSVLAAWFSSGWVRCMSVGMVVLAIGTGMGWHAYHPLLPDEAMYTVQATVASEVHLREDGQVQAVLTDVTLNGRKAANAYWTFYLDEDELLPEWLVPGARLTMAVEGYHPRGLDTPGSFSFKEYLLQRNIPLGLYGAHRLTPLEGVTLQGRLAALRHDLSLRLIAVMGSDAGAWASTMLLGARDFIPQDERALFQDLGVAHILSISGFHVGVLAGMLFLLMRPLPLRRWVHALLDASILLAYCILTGGNAPVIRATLLFLWQKYARLRNRQQLSLQLLSLTAFLQLLFEPTQLTSPSFQLTYGAMLGLVLLAPRLMQRHTYAAPPLQWLWQSFCAALAAQAGVLLPQLYWFGQMPLLSILFNLTLIPLFTGLICLYWLTLAALAIPGLGEALGGMSAWATKQLLALIHTLAAGNLSALWTRQPGPLPFIGWVLMLLSGSGLLPRQMRQHQRKLLLTGLCLMALLLVPLPQRNVTYMQFSVGDADAALLQDKDLTVVIDTGEDGQAIANYLHQRRQKVELLIITHLHIDHGGGVRALLDEGIPVEVCCLPWDAQLPRIDEEVLPLLDELQRSGTEIRFLCRGDVLPLPSGSLTVLWPPRGRVSALHDANDTGLVLQADVAGVTMLLTGDTGGAHSPYIARPADILKVPHHGSKDANAMDFISAVQPQLILQSNRLESRTQHMQALAGDIPLYTTDLCDTVTIRFLGDGAFAVETMR